MTTEREGADVGAVLTDALIDLRVPNPLRSGAEHDMEMSGIYDWDELQRFAAALAPLLAARDRAAKAEAQAWRDNYDGMFARWAECDTERLRLKGELRDVEMRLRLLSGADPGTDA